MPTTIHTADADLDITRVSSKELALLERRLYAEPAFTEEFPFKAYIREKRTTEASLRKALSSIGTMNKDFEVGADENIAFTMCGGIYTPRMFCRDYIEILFRTLQATTQKDKWAYSTSMEPPEPIDGMFMCGFILQGTTIYLDDDIGQFDFVGSFSRPLQA